MAPTVAPEPWSTTVFDLFADTVRRFPNRNAISDTRSSLTYAELWNLAAAFRVRLREQGIEPGDLVAVLAARSTATVAAILGVMMAGGCYVPVDLNDFPPASFASLARQNGIRCCIVDRLSTQSAGSSLWDGCRTIAIEDVVAAPTAALAHVPAPRIDAASPLYVMFTSGSTGAPKGVIVPHRAVSRLVMGQHFMQFGPGHTFLLHSPLSFDASTLEVWGALLHGSRLVVAPPHRLGLDEYASLISRERVTTLWLTAAMFHLAADHQPAIFEPLAQLLFGGDVISPRAVERVRGMFPALHMVNGYGPTENTTFTCCYVVPADYRAEGPLPIGFPLVHTTVHVVDSEGRDLPAGEAGELIAGGAGVALGYLGQPEATAGRFLHASVRPGAKLYRTGDLVRQRPDGSFDFLGRADDQVKIAGQRVELNAVERAICGSPLVADAAIVVLTPASGEKQLVACVRLAQTFPDAEMRLREWSLAQLSRAAMPQHWLILEQLPMNANGKLDRKALRVVCEARFPSSASQLLPGPLPTGPGDKNPQHAPAIAEHLQQLWAMLLNRTAVGPQENFFDLGGTSLLLIEMHSRLRAAFSSIPSLVEMFDFPTLQSLAQRLVEGNPHRRHAEAAEKTGQRQRAAMLAAKNLRRPAAKDAPADAVRSVSIAHAAIEDGRP